MKTSMKLAKQVISVLVCLAMLMSYVPASSLSAFAVEANNLCEHHTEHTADCHYEEGVHECHYKCDECAIAPANEEPGDETPVCTCTVKCGETADTTCAVCSAEGAVLSAVCTGTDKAEQDTTAKITGVTLTVDGVTYTGAEGEGYAFINPNSDITVSITGVNLNKMTEENVVYGQILWIDGSANWVINEDGTAASIASPASEWVYEYHHLWYENSRSEYYQTTIKVVGLSSAGTDLTTIYFNNVNAWETITATFYTDKDFYDNEYQLGTAELSLVGGESVIYSASIPNNAAYVTFSNGTTTTGKIAIPMASTQNNCYNNGTWEHFHTPEADDGNCTTAVKCSTCGETVVEAKESHTTEKDENKATCTTQAKCDLCGTEYGELGGHRFDESGLCACNTQAEAKLGDTFYGTLAEAAAAAEADATITVLTDVTIAEGETVAFANFVTLDVAEGKTVKCTGTVTIGGSSGIICENELYYFGGQVPKAWSLSNVTVPTYWTAGEGYAIFQPAAGETEAVLTLHNATIEDLFFWTVGESVITYSAPLTIRFSGTSTLTGREDCGEIFDISAKTTLVGIGDDPVLNIRGADGASNAGSSFADLTIESGTVNITDGVGTSSTGVQVNGTLTVKKGAALNAASGNATRINSVGVLCSTLVVDGTLNATHGTSGSDMEACFSAGIMSLGSLTVTGSGTVNALVFTGEAEGESAKYIYTVYGAVALDSDRAFADPYAGTEDAGQISFSFTVSKDSTLTINKGVTLDLSTLALTDITLIGSIANKGTLKLPAGFDLENAPTGGTLYIGEKSYTWDSENRKWVCANDDSHVTEKEANKATCEAKAKCDLCGESYGEFEPHSTTAEGDKAATCKNKAYCSVCQSEYGEVDKTNHDETVDEFDANGFCAHCSNGYEPAALGEDGYYQITNAGQLYWFASQVNSGNRTINGKLMNNIVDNANLMQKLTFAEDGTATVKEGETVRHWILIGNRNEYLKGTFDGQGYTVSGLYFNCPDTSVIDYSTAGFISNVIDGKVCNVGLVDSYIRGETYTGGVVGNALRSTVENCWNEATVVGGLNAGGIVGSTNSNTIIQNCYNTGTIIGFERDAAGISICSGSEITVRNCWNSGTIRGGDSSYPIYNYYGAVENCYYLASSETDSHDGTTFATAEQFASGEVTYLLNGDQSNIVWKQIVGTGMPAFTGKTVYRIGICDTFSYTNDAAAENKPHTYVNGICTNIEGENHYEPATDVDSDGVYEISNAGQLFWFAELVNGGTKNANAVLTAHIDLEGRSWTPIAQTASYHASAITDTGYTGIFDGQNHVVRNFKVECEAGNGGSGADGNVKSYGLFGTVSGTVRNLGIDGFSFDSTAEGKADCRAGGIAGQLLTGGTIESCYTVNSSILTGSRIAGGIAGCNYGGTIKNCFAYGNTVTGHERCAAIVGDTVTDSGAPTRLIGSVANCYADKAPVGSQNGGDAYITNCAQMTAEQFASGEVAYKLGAPFGQTIGTDSYPVLGGAKVYYGYISCAAGATMIYTNAEATAEKPSHSGSITYTPNNNGTHNGTYPCCGTVYVTAQNCSGGTATCSALAQCQYCGSAYGSLNASNHNFDSTTGNCGDCNTPLAVASATIGTTTTFYRSLNDAVQAVTSCTAEDKAMVKLLTNVTIFGSDGKQEMASGVFTFDLNGFTLSSKDYVALIIYTDVTITDSAGTGKITSPNYALVVSTGADVTISGGSIYGEIADICLDGGQVNLIEGVTFPDGISVVEGTLQEILDPDCFYIQNDMPIFPANNDTEIAGDDVTIQYAACEGSGTEADPYKIYTRSQLYWFASKVNGGQTAIYGELAANITVNANVLAQDGTLNEGSYLSWIPMGTGASPYTGTFDGKNFTISGLYFNHANVFFVGLFGASSGTIQNVNIADSYFCGGTQVGAIVGDNRGTVIGCSNSGTVTGTEGIGGIAGDLDRNAVIKECTNTGSISGTVYVGGIVGGTGSSAIGDPESIQIADCHNSGTVTGGTAVGGILGSLRMNVHDCHNSGTITATGTSVGGIAGQIYQDFNGLSRVISGCTNTGNITGTEKVGGISGEGATLTECWNSGNIKGTEKVGGLTGAISDGISLSYNTGTVTGTNYVGGLVGYEGVKIVNSYNTGAVTGINTVGGIVGYQAPMTNCYNIGKVTGETNTAGLIGTHMYNDAYLSQVFINSYYLEGTAEQGYTTSGTDESMATAAQFASGEVAYLLQGKQETQVWGQTIGTDSYPVLGGAKVYCGYADCNATEVSYSNTELPTESGHSYSENGECLHCGNPDPDARLTGDLNLDGAVDAQDLTMLARHVAGIELLTNAVALANADVDGNGEIDANDLTTHARFVAGIISHWKTEE